MCCGISPCLEFKLCHIKCLICVYNSAVTEWIQLISKLDHTFVSMSRADGCWLDQTAPVLCFLCLDCSRSATVARNQKHNSIHEMLGGLIHIIINSSTCVVSAHIWLSILWKINVQAMSSSMVTGLGTSELIRKPIQDCASASLTTFSTDSSEDIHYHIDLQYLKLWK